MKTAAAEQEGYVAEQQAEVARAERDRATEFANIVVPAEIERDRVRTEAEGEKQKDILAGEAEGEAMRARLAGEAMGRMEILTKMADGLREIVGAAGGDPDKAASLMIVDKLEEIAGVQANAISNIDFDKIVVYDGGNGNAVGSFLSGLTKALPPFHEVARMAGIELPEFLGEMAKDGAAAPCARYRGQQSDGDLGKTGSPDPSSWCGTLAGNGGLPIPHDWSPSGGLLDIILS